MAGSSAVSFEIAHYTSGVSTNYRKFLFLVKLKYVFIGIMEVQVHVSRFYKTNFIVLSIYYEFLDYEQSIFIVYIIVLFNDIVSHFLILSCVADIL